ncbi:MAG: ATP-binding cassette domain-containing protein [Candidatus Omnitrophica bacterium]|nr:ATP-binding cassette domain-containing protein [Candidatus Omnitrophota bacterium]
MSVLLQLKGIGKRYGHTTILEEASASFSKNQKIGVIGRNGAGKSTLCKIIIGEEEMDTGEVIKNSELRLNYLEQHDSFGPEETIIQFLTRSSGEDDWRAAEMASNFQLDNEILDTKITSLAGGYRTRVKLAAMLLKNPNFLVLDEPSNYLDLSTLILLENFLLEFNGGYLIVSHDREFLKRTCDHTLEVENGRLTLYPGNIEDYFEFKEEQLAQKLAYNKTVEKKKEQLQEFVDRFKAKASTATRAKSKMKLIEKLKTIEIAHSAATVNIRIPQIEKKGGVAFSSDDLSVGYPDRTVASRIRIEVERGERVAVLGDNGQGKTTFLRTIAGNLPSKGGSFRWGTGLKIAYYAQHVFSTLHPSDDIFTHLSREAADGVSTQDVLNMAGCFLFSGDEVKKKVSVLSGGERARLCLAGLLLSKSHVILLDEPTNHLDFETVEALGRALKSFAGTIFFISHDRTFVNLIATSIVDVKNGVIAKYPGSYEDYVYHLEMHAKSNWAAHSHDAKPSHHTASSEGVAAPTNENESEVNAKEHQRDLKKEMTVLKSRIKKMETRLKHLEEEKQVLLKQIQNNPFHYSRDRNQRLKELTQALEREEAEWLKLQENLEVLQKGALS